jgi:superfamily II DNA or RNA helicase
MVQPDLFASKVIHHIIFDDSLLTVAPSPAGIEERLKYTEKKMEEYRAPGARYAKRVTRHYKVDMFRHLSTAPFVVLQTYAGLLDRILQFLVAGGLQFQLHDDRLAFPEPRLDLMHGFRFKQRELLTEFLLKRRSGLLGAPTRYGKTTLMKNVLRAFPDVTTVVAIPGIDLVRQGYQDIKEALPKRDVVLLGGGSTKKFPSTDITVCSMDSLHRCDPGRTRLVLVDEPHAIVTDSRAVELFKFDQARKYGFGATTSGRYDQRDIWIESLLGTLLVNRTYSEAVEEGAICPLVVYMLKIKFDPFFVRSRDKAYNELLYHSPRIAELTARICRGLIPDSWQTLVFIKDESQAEFYLKEVGEDGVVVMAKLMTAKERKEKMRLMQENIIKRCLASKIYAQGVTFSDVRCLVNVEGGGGSISSVQKPGRLAEIRPGKACGIVFDFLFECSASDEERKSKEGTEWWNVVRDSRSRMEVYKEKGYEVHVLDTWQQLKESFKNRAHETPA